MSKPTDLKSEYQVMKELVVGQEDQLPSKLPPAHCMYRELPKMQGGSPQCAARLAMAKGNTDCWDPIGTDNNCLTTTEWREWTPAIASFDESDF